MANPLTELRNIIGQQLSNYAPLLAKLGGGTLAGQKMQLWDREADARGDMKDNPDLRLRLQMDPEQSNTQIDWSSSAAKFTRTWTILIQTGSTKLEDVEELEWLITKALTSLRVTYNGQSDPPPLIVEDIALGQIDPDREPTSDETFGEWTALMQVTIVAIASHLDLAA